MNMPENNILYSVIIPAYNEEKFLPDCLTALKNAMHTIEKKGEIIVTDNNSTDKTSELAKRFGARVVFEKKNHISRARNRGAENAKGKFLVFLDADTIISPGLLKAAIGNLESGSCCGGGSLVSLDRVRGRWDLKFVRLWNRIATRRNVAAGCFIYCLKEAFSGVGGFSEKVYVSEELWLSRALKKWGRKNRKAFRIIRDFPIKTSGRKMDRPFRCLVATFLCVFFPIFIFSRTLCWFWYKRKFEE